MMTSTDTHTHISQPMLSPSGRREEVMTMLQALQVQHGEEHLGMK
jgi:hypothetical protein